MNPPNQPTPRTNAAWAKTFEFGVNQFWSGNAANQMRDECEKLERELTETERLRFGADADRRQLRCDLSDAKAEASHYMAVAQKATDELIFFRADNLKAHQMTCAAALERDAEREKVRVLREALENLIDEQNGVPLYTREEQWKQAMDGAEAALAATEESK